MAFADTLSTAGTVRPNTSDWNARRDAEIFTDLARRTGGCVLPFDASAPGRLRDLLAAVVVYAVGGRDLLEERLKQLLEAPTLLRPWMENIWRWGAREDPHFRIALAQAAE